MPLGPEATKVMMEFAAHAGAEVNRDGQIVSFVATPKQLNAWLDSTPLGRVLDNWIRAEQCRMNGFHKQRRVPKRILRRNRRYGRRRRLQE